MEKFIRANDCALRISDTGVPRKPRTDETPDAAASKTDPRMTIVLLHGYLGSLDGWDDFTKLISPPMRVIAVDIPGHGISEVKGEVHTMEFLADTLYETLKITGVERCVVCGHSMGGYVALEFLRKYPEMLAGIILLHSVPFADTPEKKETRRREIDIIKSGKKDLLAATASKAFAPFNRKRMEDKIQEVADQTFITEDEGILALLRGMGERRDSSETLRQSNVPQLLIFGKGDEFIPEEAAVQIIEQHPQAKSAWLEKSGHIGFLEQPRESADLIIEFCAKLDWR